MPDISQANLKQWCVIWQRQDTKSRKGIARLGSPSNVRCRWVISDQNAVSQEASREAYPRHVPVGVNVALGSYVWGPGKIADLPSSPTYFEVIGVEQTPDLKGRHPTYVITLQKASKTLPEVVS